MQNNQSEQQLAALSRALVWDGFVLMLPISAFVLVFGMAFGLAASQIGLSLRDNVVMSALVFAGAAQFASLELWGAQVSALTLAATVFAINARHLLMGATLYPWVRHLPPAQRFGVMALASDVNWAMAMQAFGAGKPGLGVLFGGGMALWLAWVAGTGLGALFGGVIQDPRRYGLDMVMGCFLLAMVVGGKKDLRVVMIWVTAALTSLLAHRYLGHNSHVIAGAVAGGLLGAVWPEASDPDVPALDKTGQTMPERPHKGAADAA